MKDREAREGVEELNYRITEIMRERIAPLERKCEYCEDIVCDKINAILEYFDIELKSIDEIPAKTICVKKEKPRISR